MHLDDAKVVVVDDVCDVADALSAQLRADGYQVFTAYSAEQALQLVAEHRPQCVLLDISMPGMDGQELAALLRRQNGDDVVLVAITGRSAEEPRVAGTFALVDHYFRKPVDPKELRKVLPWLSDAPAIP